MSHGTHLRFICQCMDVLLEASGIGVWLVNSCILLTVLIKKWTLAIQLILKLYVNYTFCHFK